MTKVVLIRAMVPMLSKNNCLLSSLGTGNLSSYKLLDKYQQITIVSLLEQYQIDYPGLFHIEDFEGLSEVSESYPYKNLGFSFGIAEYQITDTLHHMINRADNALYEMKRLLQIS